MGKKNGFVINNNILEERSDQKDLFDLDSKINELTVKFKSINKPSIFALVGPFGSGKSTLLNNIHTKKLKNSFWFEFDAWKYPNKENLWEGFVIDLSRKISPKAFKDVDKKIKGEQTNDIKELISVLSKIPFRGASVISGLNHFFRTSPATRVDEIQKILETQLLTIKQEVYIIVEDIDRSGDAGIFFIETLKQFVKSYNSLNKILVIVPVADDNYHKNLNSYLKSVDYFEFIETRKLKLDRFVDEVFDSELFEDEKRDLHSNIVWTGSNRRSQTISFLEGLFILFPDLMTLRLLKLILRKANLVYKSQNEDGLLPDFRVTLCVEASKYFDYNEGQKYYQLFKKEGMLRSGNIFTEYLSSMILNKDNLFNSNLETKQMTLNNSGINFKIVERVDNDSLKYPSYPYRIGNPFTSNSEFAILKQYFQY